MYPVFLSFFLLLLVHSGYGQLLFTLDDIIRKAKEEAPASKQAETRKENRYWYYQLYKANFNPQLTLQGSLPNYYKEVRQVIQGDGTYEYIPVEQSNSNIGVGLSQQLPWTGGQISANTGLAYFKDYKSTNVNSEEWSGTLMNIRLDQPLFAFNQMHWDKKTEPLRYEESKREYVEQTEFISSEVVERFFSVLQEQVKLQIAQFNLANNDTIYKIEQGRYNIGTTSLDKLLQVELQLLRSRQDVAQANLGLETARLRLRSFIGLREGDQYDLMLPETIPSFGVTVDEALDYARKNRSAYLAFERRRIEADRDVAEARGSRFQARIGAAYGLNNNGLVMSDVYVDPEEMQQFNLSMSIPILNWGRNKASMRTAIANKQYNDYQIAQDEINFEQEIITQVRQFEMLRLQIEITRKADEVATERYNVAQNRYLIGKIDITNLNIALTEKDNAKLSYLEALRLFWSAYYNLRRLTLYDFSAKQLLYTVE